MSCGGSFESSWHSGVDFGARIDRRENFYFNEERFYVTVRFGNMVEDIFILGVCREPI